jgi:transcription termination factor Rho
MLGNSVFVGYSRVDSEFALRIAKDLKGAGVGVWIDENIRPGDRWRAEIGRAIQNCTAMVVILSPDSVGSLEVENEVSYALDQRKPVIPILYKKCEIPYYLRLLQHVDFRSDYQRALAVIFEKLGVAETIGFQFKPNAALSEAFVREPGEVAASFPADARDTAPFPDDRTALTPSKLQKMTAAQLARMAKDLEIPGYRSASADDLIYRILQVQSEKVSQIFAAGVLEVQPDGSGFLRAPEYNYLPGPDDMFVTPSQIKQFRLRTGDSVAGEVRPPRVGETFFSLTRVVMVNHDDPTVSAKSISFDNLTPFDPVERLKLETGSDDMNGRVMDIVVPMGKGQRALIIAPQQTGATTLLQSMAGGITANCPEMIPMVLLVGARPEEIARLRRDLSCDVIGLSPSEPVSDQIRGTNLVFERAKRLVEHHRDVAILLDSISRLARAYGTDSEARVSIKRLFDAARNTKEGGSLTIVAIASAESNRIDEMMVEELKAMANMEVYLIRELADKTLFPAIDIKASRTHNVERLLPANDLAKVSVLRKVLSPLQTWESTQLLIERLRKSRNNVEFFKSMTRG